MEPQRTSPQEQEIFIPESQRELPSTHVPRSRWLAIAVLTALWHLFLLWFSADVRPPAPRERTVINTIDPGKLEAIRRQQRGLLLSKDPPPAEKAPDNPNARFDSDRNRRVEREQRAARTDVLPQPSGGGAKTEGSGQKNPRAQAKAPEKPKLTQPKINLSNLGALSNITRNAGRPAPAREAEEVAAGGQTGEIGSGADQSIHDPNLPVGAENLLNTRESVYYTFYARIYRTIGPVWQSRIRQMTQRQVPPGQYVTQVEVVLDSEGNFIETRFMKNSGIPEFDESVTHAWQQIRNFPNPPKDLIGSDGFVRMGWNFLVQVDENMMWNHRSPSRAY